jgi:replicative DNA helicase
MAHPSATPPHDLEAEQSLLGSILLDPEVMINVMEQIHPDHFYENAHGLIFDAMRSLYDKRNAIDVVTITDQLKKMKKLSEAGGSSKIASLSNIVSTAAHHKSYANIIRELWTKRQMISLSTKLHELALDPGEEINDIIDEAEQHVFSLSQRHNQQSFSLIKETLAESFERLDELQRNAGELRGLPTGFMDLDSMLAGFQKSNLIILAARPGMGKTAFGLNIAQYMATVAKKKVGIFSLEMSKEELVDRLLVGQADIDAWRLKTGRLDQQDFMKLSEAMGVLAEAQIFIDDTPGLSIFEIRTKARRLMAEHNIDMLMLDYLQLAHGRSLDNRVQEVAEISQGMKNIARELKIPVLALSQLSRAIENRGEKTPQLSDLRESGCVTGDTLVTLADSNWQLPISELVGKSNFKVWSLNQENHKLEKATVSNVFPTGRKKVFELKTQLGRVIKATANHKFLTIEGWKRLDELTKNDHLALPRVIPTVKPKQKMTESELALLGHLIGDGCTLPRHSIQYTTREEDLAEMVQNLAKEVFGKEVEPRIKQERSWYQVYLSSTRKHTHGKGSAVSDWLKQLGVWGLRSAEKRIPELVFSQSSSSIGIFLKHLWVTDGCIKVSQNEKVYPSIYYASSSSQLAYGAQTLLLSLGIISRVRVVSQGSKGGDQYHVTVSGQQDVAAFVEKIGTVGKYKLESLSQVKKYLTLTKANTNRDIISKSIWSTLIKPIMKQKSVSQRALCDAIGTARSGAMFSQNLSRDRLARIGEALGSNELLELANSDLYWDKISQIVPSGSEEVYDLTVPAHANFVANNMVIHNSIEQDADVVMFLYRKDDDIREAVNLKIAKHRNGSVGEIDLYFKGDRIKFFGMEARR